MVSTAVKVAILNSEGRATDARKILNAEVARTNSFSAHLLRGSYLNEIGDKTLAEKDYQLLISLDKSGRGYELLAGFYAQSGRMDEAIAVIQKGIAAYPDDIDLKRGLVDLLLNRARPEDNAVAAELLKTLEKAQPDDPEVLYVRANLMVKTGRPEDLPAAETMLNRVVQLQPSHADAQLLIIGLMMQRGDYASARDMAIRARGANPGNVRLLVARAAAEKNLGNVELAGELARMVLADAPGNPDALTILANVLSDKNDQPGLTELKLQIADAISRDAGNESLHLSQAKVLSSLGDGKSAIDNLHQFSTKQNRPSVPVLLMLSDLYRTQGDMERAGAMLAEVVRIAPDNGQVVRTQVIFLGLQGKLDAVADVMTRYAASKSPVPEDLLVGADILSSSSNSEHVRKASQLYAQALATAPKLLAAQMGEAMLALRSGDADKAETMYRKVLQADARNVQALNGLAWILADVRHDYPAALVLANKAVGLDPNNIHVRDTRGVILKNTSGRMQDARNDFAVCVKNSQPDTSARARALLQLGRVDMQLGRKVDAVKSFTEALQIQQKKNALTSEEVAEMTAVIKENGGK
jgi:tetratricopeptide (TPR) repeat protein